MSQSYTEIRTLNSLSHNEFNVHLILNVHFWKVRNLKTSCY